MSALLVSAFRYGRSNDMVGDVSRCITLRLTTIAIIEDLLVLWVSPTGKPIDHVADCEGAPRHH